MNNFIMCAMIKVHDALPKPKDYQSLVAKITLKLKVLPGVNGEI
tara:strand:- start:2632 stop:2763 length:132 start_codon:yes stop_codon:yes gene_type:complete